MTGAAVAERTLYPAMFAPRPHAAIASRPMSYRHRDHEAAAAWPELHAWLGYLTAGNAARRTVEQYERTCSKILLEYPNTAYADFTDAELLAVLGKWPPRSRHVRKAAINGWFKWGYRSRRISTNPADLLPDIRYKPNRNIQVFDPLETAALRGLPGIHGLLMTVLLETGIRNQEARMLTVQRVDFRAQEVLIREGAKGGKERRMPLTTAAVAAFNELILTEGLNPRDHFWCCHPGGSARPHRATPLASSTFARWWRLCLAEGGVSYRKPHTTRHTFATFWMDDRLDDADVQMMLGHESIRTTRDIYDHRRLSKVGDKMRALESDMTALGQAGVGAN